MTARQPEGSPSTTFSWATITATSPLRIRLDGDTDPLPLTPACLVTPATLGVGKRAWVQLYGRRVVVIGVHNGGA